ncbi:hypothetical protein [Acidovorax radicis]|jgi:hypothetical protein|uniref:hypothetical protein n=1 Tax=Acidovorax radicis TaxID=758826 RepID=UPI00031CD21E|nr:hypothetical protein [Acidovorax radicis]
MEPSEADVKRLADAWMPFATVVEDEITLGWVGSEPPRLVWRIKAYLAQHDSNKARQFEERFFKHLK